MLIKAAAMHVGRDRSGKRRIYSGFYSMIKKLFKTLIKGSL
jgi:hypothetical protein